MGGGVFSLEGSGMMLVISALVLAWCVNQTGLTQQSPLVKCYCYSCPSTALPANDVR